VSCQVSDSNLICGLHLLIVGVMQASSLFLILKRQRKERYKEIEHSALAVVPTGTNRI
jgi:hypothetical protein